ncbi:MAG: phytanoyl-CoA dioxygenase family protein [Caldilineaceae bacterium]|nr:phytanoyl-CoA dioxygenase family protein [Caldilineaceae bacterium]
MSDSAQGTTDAVTESQVAQYERDGFIVVPNLFSEQEAAQWKEALKARVAELNKLEEPSGVCVMMPEMMDPYTSAKVQDAKIVGILEQLIGPNVEFLSVKAVFKNAKTSFNSPWHHDWAYWLGSNKISIWIALDDADPDNGCMRMAPGSHKQVADMQKVEDRTGFGNRISEDALQGQTIETLPVRRGDAIFFHDLTLHASCPNTSGRDRWCAIATYRDASQKDSSTVWRSSIVLSGESVNS